MKTIVSFLLGCSMAIPVFTQDRMVTFTATVETAVIDSVTALNLNRRTNNSITIPGDASLILKVTTGIPHTTAPDSRMDIFPNPFSGDSRVVLGLSRYQKVSLTVYNLIGQPIARTGETFEPGEHEFALSVKENGIYTVVVETPDKLLSSKAVCLDAAGRENSLRYLGGTSGPRAKSGQQPVLNNPSGYELEYSTGDVVHYTCHSSVMTTIFTDTPTESVNYEVAFVSCTDPDGRHYKTVRIGEQTWMAENLAYLPSTSTTGPDTEKHYYVYGNYGSVSDAKRDPNYTTYGVLYNWEAANTACPTGWHLPTDDEWKVLEKHLGMSESDVNNLGLRTSGNVGIKLRSTAGWSFNCCGDNSSGFNAVPGGCRVGWSSPESGSSRAWDWASLGYVAYFWSSTEYGSFAWLRSLDINHDGVDRYNEVLRRGFSVRCLKNE